MIFQHTWPKIIEQKKNATRRLVAPSETVIRARYNKIAAVLHNGRVKWRIGETYAVQPGRGKPHIARIRLTRITRERVSRISTAAAIAEGFSSRQAFLRKWDEIHGKGKRESFVWVIEFELVVISVPSAAFAKLAVTQSIAPTARQ